MLLTSLTLVGACILGAVLYRIRGGWLGRYIPGGTLPARLIWCIPTGALVGLLTWNPIVGAATAVAAYLALMTPHGRWFDIGRGGDRVSDDMTAMAVLGLTRLYLMLLPLLLIAWTPLIPLVAWVGLLHAPLYWLAWKMPVPYEWRKAGDKAIVDFETAWGELLWGGTQWLTLAAVCLFLI